MKIVFTGGGTGGHFTPIIAIAESVNKIIDQENIVGAKLYFFSTDPYDREALFENGIQYEEIATGKIRTYFSLKNITDIPKIGIAVIVALIKLFRLYPDVVFSKGAFASFPTVLAARLLFIPVVIHESDSVPGKMNLWSGKFAKRIAVSYQEAAQYFPKDKVAWTGQPVRTGIQLPTSRDKASEFFKIEKDLPTIFIMGGSQGAELINQVILDALPRLLKNYQVIHQTGVRNFKMVKERAEVVLANDQNMARYVPIDYLNNLQMKNAAGAADFVISRAGSAIFEIASWGIPSLLIPFSEEKMGSNAIHAKKNAFTYARAGAATVVEEENLTANILVAEIDRIMGDKATWLHMQKSAKDFYKPEAAAKIAREVIDIALSHEN
ncbi:MAG: UDP-N-acetylglucosamine--N-acetylmuramyl-(pentapeptide) pyrophosphoryl-undecaprenol N-acetylglucosamine transferase [Candidatus Paceibacterota bacterium]